MIMKQFSVALLVLGAASPALAISRYNTLSLTCEAARQKVINEGAAILRYPSTRGKGMTLYDRYVTRNEQCDAHEDAEASYVPTRDNARCPVLNCQTYDPVTGNGIFGKPRIRF